VTELDNAVLVRRLYASDFDPERLDEFLGSNISRLMRRPDQQRLNPRGGGDSQWLKKRFARIDRGNRRLGALLGRERLLPLEPITHCRLTDAARERIRTHYAEQNRGLDEARGLHLQRYDYY